MVYRASFRYGEDMKSFLDLATNRRSVRKYKSEPVPEEVLMRILTAGQMAPSGNNSQPWRFIIVNDAKTKEELFKVAGRQEWILSAPLTIAIVADLKAKLPQNRMDEEISIDDNRHINLLLKSVRDASIAADHIVMAAADEGLGSCWIALYEQDDICPVLDVPRHCYVVAIVTIGYPDEKPDAKPRKRLSDIASWNSFKRNPWSCA